MYSNNAQYVLGEGTLYARSYLPFLIAELVRTPGADVSLEGSVVAEQPLYSDAKNIYPCSKQINNKRTHLMPS